MNKWKEFWLNRISITIWDVEVYHKDYINEGLPERKYFLTQRAARKFVKQVQASKNYVTSGYGGVTVWLVGSKFEFPEY